VAGLIDTAISGLRISQLGLSVTGNNIVNAGTEGYTRQSVSADTNLSIFHGVGYVGTGVTADQIFRNTEQFLIDKVVEDLSVLGEFEYYHSNVSHMDNILADPGSSLSNSMNNFFEALNTSANDPAGIEGRQLLLTQSHMLINKFKSIEESLLSQNRATNQQMDAFAHTITNIAESISALNAEITSSEGITSGIFPNDLLDRRDQLVRDLSKIVDVQTTVQPNMSLDVYIGEGQGLVIGPETAVLTSIPGTHEPTRRELAFVFPNNTHVVTEQISGGELGGLLRYRKEALEPALNSLGRIALGLTDAFNKQQGLGVDLQGELGGAIFTDINDPALMYNRVHSDVNNAEPGDRLLSVRIDDVNKLTTSDYRIDFTGPGRNYSVIRQTDGKLVTQGILGQKTPAEFSVDGFTVNFEAGTFQAGDSYLVEPTKRALGDIDVVISRAEGFAFASPLNTRAGIGNRGSALIQVEPTTNVGTTPFSNVPTALQPPVLIRFTSPTSYDVLDYSDPANPVSLVPPLNNQVFAPGIANTVFPDDPGGTTVSTEFNSAGILRERSNGNGYPQETLTVTRIDPETGRATITRVPVAQDTSAQTIAHELSVLDGVSARASSQLQLHNFVSDGSGIPLSLVLNDVDLTDPDYIRPGDNAPLLVPDPPTADYLADRINQDLALQAQGIFASSDGIALTIKSTTGVDLQVDVGGNGDDSVQVRDGDLRSVFGRNHVSNGYEVLANSKFDLDLGFGATTVTLSPGIVGSGWVLEALQADIDRFMGAGVVAASLNASGNIELKSVDRTRVLSISNVSDDDPLGIAPITISGPDLGNQPATLANGVATADPIDFSVQNGSFILTVDGTFTDVITLNQNFPVNSGNAMVVAINNQIDNSTVANGLAGRIRAELLEDGRIQFVSNSTGVDAGFNITVVTEMQGIVNNGNATGTQLSGSRAIVTGGNSINEGLNFDLDGPHSFNISVDGSPPVNIELTGSTGTPAVYSGTVNVFGGVDFSGPANSHTFELTVDAHPTVLIDLSGVDTSLAADPFSDVPQGIAHLMQQQIDNTLGPGLVTVGLDGANNLTLTTVDGGSDSSITVANVTGNVAAGVFPVPATVVGIQSGGAAVLNMISSAINDELAALGHNPVEVGVDEQGALIISSTTYGDDSEIILSDVEGGFGVIFPGSAMGERFNNSITIGGTLDVQLGSGTTLASDLANGLFGLSPDAISNYTGYQVSINSGLGENGSPQFGDTFVIDYNKDGTSDNRNALAMMQLDRALLFGEGNLTLNAAYGQVVEDIGILTSQAKVSQEAALSLLRQSEAELQSIAGVNIDEEAALLIKLEQHYNASAQLISIARDMFDTILGI